MSTTAARMDPRQSPASKTQATSEQIRLAQILEFSRTDDADAIRMKIKQIVETTGCTENQAVMILHDCDNDVNKAVQKILDEGVGEDEWTVQSRKVKRQHADNHDHGAHSDDDNEDSFSGSGADAMIAYGRRQKRGGFAAGAGFPAGAADDSGPRFGGGGGRGGFHAVRGGRGGGGGRGGAFNKERGGGEREFMDSGRGRGSSRGSRRGGRGRGGGGVGGGGGGPLGTFKENTENTWNGSVEARTWQSGTGKPAKPIENNLWDNSMAEPPREQRRSGGGGGIPSRMEHWQGPPQQPDEWESNDEWSGKQMVFTNSARQAAGGDSGGGAGGGAMLGTAMDPRQFKAVPDAAPMPAGEIPSVIGMTQQPRDTAKQNGPTSYVATANGNAAHMTTSNWAAQEATKSLKSTLGIGANEVLNAQQQRPLVAHPPVSTMSYAAQAGKQIARAPVEMPGNSYGNLDVQFGSFDSALPSFDDAGKVAGQKILSSATGMGAGGGGGGFPPATPPKADQQINQLLKSAATAQDPYRSAAVGVAKQNLTGSSLKPATEPPGKKPASQQQPADLLSSIATSNYPGGAVAGGNAYLHSATPNITTTPHKAQTPGGTVDQRLNFGSSSLNVPAAPATHETGGTSSYATTPSKSGSSGSMQHQHQYASTYDAQSAVDTNTVSQNIVSQLNSLNLNPTRMPATAAAAGANRPVMAANTPASNVAVTAAPNQQLQQFFQQYASAVPQNYFQQPMAMFPNALGLNYATGMPDFSSMFQQQAAVIPQFDVTGQPVFQASSNLSSGDKQQRASTDNILGLGGVSLNSSVAQPPGLTPTVSNAQLAAQYIMPPFLYPPQLATTAQQFATGPASFILPQVTQTNAQVTGGPLNAKAQHALLQQFYGAPGGGGFDEINAPGGAVNDLSKVYGGGSGTAAAGNTNPLTGQSLQQQQQKNATSTSGGGGGVSANDFIKNFGAAGGAAGQVLNKPLYHDSAKPFNVQNTGTPPPAAAYTTGFGMFQNPAAAFSAYGYAPPMLSPLAMGHPMTNSLTDALNAGAGGQRSNQPQQQKPPTGVKPMVPPQQVLNPYMSYWPQSNLN